MGLARPEEAESKRTAVMERACNMLETNENERERRADGWGVKKRTTLFIP